MTDRTPDQPDAPERTAAADRDGAPDQAGATVRLGRRLIEADDPEQSPRGPAPDGSTSTAGGTGSGPAVPAAPAPRRDDRTVDLGKRETATVRVDRESPSPWAPAARSAAPYSPTPPQPAAPAPGDGPSGGAWSAPQPPPSWSAQQPPPSWPAPPAWSGQPESAPWGGTRAMPQPVTPPLPPPRGRGHGPLVVFGILAALVIAGGAWALIALVAGSSPFGPGGVDDPRADAPITTDAPLPSDPILPLPPSYGPGTGTPDDPAPTDGPSGQVVVTWTLEGTAYRATLTTAGSTGSAEVTYTVDGQVRTVRQDLTLASEGGRRAYVGSSPVDTDTGAPSTTYAPDVFLLTTNPEGNVYIDEVCDTTGICSPASME